MHLTFIKTPFPQLWYLSHFDFFFITQELGRFKSICTANDLFRGKFENDTSESLPNGASDWLPDYFANSLLNLQKTIDFSIETWYCKYIDLFPYYLLLPNLWEINVCAPWQKALHSLYLFRQEGQPLHL